MLRILGEDKAMVERLRPEALPQEYSVRADLPQIAFRWAGGRQRGGGWRRGGGGAMTLDDGRNCRVHFCHPLPYVPASPPLPLGSAHP